MSLTFSLPLYIHEYSLIIFLQWETRFTFRDYKRECPLMAKLLCYCCISILITENNLSLTFSLPLYIHEYSLVIFLQWETRFTFRNYKRECPLMAKLLCYCCISILITEHNLSLTFSLPLYIHEYSLVIFLQWETRFTFRDYKRDCPLMPKLLSNPIVCFILCVY